MIAGGDDNPEEINRRVKRLGPRQKEWDQLSAQQKRKQSQSLYDELKRASNARGVESSLESPCPNFTAWTKIRVIMAEE